MKKAKPPAQGRDETTYLNTFLDARKSVLCANAMRQFARCELPHLGRKSKRDGRVSIPGVADADGPSASSHQGRACSNFPAPAPPLQLVRLQRHWQKRFQIPPSIARETTSARFGQRWCPGLRC